MKGGWMLLLLLTASLGGCRTEADERAPVSGDARPDRTGPMRPPEAHIEGNFVLTTVGGATVPATLEQVQEQPGCRTEIVDATLRLEAGRFAFQNRVREVCGDVVREPVIHAAGGSYTIDGSSVVLAADVGGAFTQATGTADETSLTLQQMTSDAGAQQLAWRFERLGPELVPQEGADDRTDQTPR